MTDGREVGRANLQVDRGELFEGLRQLARIIASKEARGSEAILGFADGQCWVRLGGSEIAASASGTWRGEARVPARFVLTLPEGMSSATDLIPIQVDGGRLKVGAMSVACHWQGVGAAQLEIPIGASLAQILRVTTGETDDALEQSGVLAQVKEARQRRRELVEKVATVLKPLAVGLTDVDRLVDVCLERERSRAEGRGAADGQEGAES